ncbi:YjgF-like protein [Annulohypoxylon maeteangense]|uniref:YjgF-like protein n=1 Tax=Annulohypoxylon maeteangense TaxID=1927788 RepID=UPI0020085295|nr:YjgF-like protein [Annulohypoxylon maeteangense]KAI0882875.1 YjgF-like protein [Annulohypoxylon maeteangense]
MSPNGEAFLLDPNTPPGATRYAHARIAPASAHRTIYVSGIAAVTPDGKLEGATENADGTWNLDIREQTAAVLRRIDAIIRGASNGKGGIHNVIDSVVYIIDMKSNYAGMNEEWNKIFADRASAPARATVGVQELPDPRFIVEVKVVAVVDFE